MSDISKSSLIGNILDGGQIELTRMRRQTEQLKALKEAEETAPHNRNAPSVGGNTPEEAATQFEALLLQQMMKEMWKTVPSAGLLTGSREEELYRDMLNQQIAKEIAETQPLGIKDLILGEMEKRGEVVKKPE